MNQEKKMIKKLFIISVSVFLLLLLSVGCSSQKNASDQPEQKQSSASATAESGSADNLTEKAKVTLKFLILADHVESMKAAIQPYLNDHPEINLEFVPVEFDQLNKKAINASLANDPFDLIQVNHVDTLSFIQGNVIHSLNDFVQRDGVDFSQYVYPSLLEAGMYSGELYSVPYNTDTRVLAINKDMFEKHQLQPPKTQQEMLEIGKKLTQNGEYGFVNAMTRHIYMPVYEQGVFLAARGGQIYKIDESGKFVATIDNQIMRDYLQFNVDLLEIMPKDSLTMKEDEGRKVFADGKAGMYIFGPWEFGLMKDAKVNYELVTIPAGPDGTTGSTSGGYQLAIGKNSAHPEEAWGILKYLITNPEAMAKANDGTGMPTSAEAYKLPPFNDAKYDVLKKQLETSRLPAIPVANYSEVVEKFNDYYQKVLFKRMSIEDAVKEAQVQVQKLLDKNN